MSTKRRVRMYNAFVWPVFTYNCAAWGLTEAAVAKLSAFHRRQLRKLLGVRWPQRMSREAVYRTTGACRLEDFVRQARMRMLGHVLRMARDTPAQVSMDLYFREGSRPVGRPAACLAASVKKDLGEIGYRFRTAGDLAALRERAQDREAWRQLVRLLTTDPNQ